MTTGGQDARARLRAALDEMASSLPARAVTVVQTAKMDEYLLFPGPPAADLEVSFDDRWAELSTMSSEFTLDFKTDRESIDWFLAICDAVRDGRVWEVRSRWGCVQRTVYRLQSRGVRQVLRDTGYGTVRPGHLPRRERVAPWPREEARA
jgi:hypothetical protein